MYEYKLTPIDVVFLNLSSPLVLSIVIVVSLVIGYFIQKAESRKVKVLLTIILVFVIISIPLLTTAKLFLGWDWYGYEYDGKLHVKAWPVDEFVDLRNAEIILTNSSEWRPKIRTFGEGTTYLGMGYYKLENGVKAVVFRHKNSDSFVVINASGKYYVIIHPGVEKLYKIMRVKK
ncbi:MAG: hypothetical protein H0Z28_11435 [Archaeoglobus sp.]|nr:hypothetical protein [Archaeoglobus sp.]